MDISDEPEQSKRPSSILSQHHVSSSPSDHIIPQMIITSAEDSEQKNVSECTLVLIPPSNGHSIGKSDNDTSSNSVSEQKPVEDFEDISVVVKDVVSKCTESVSHSIRQRPLVIEVDKNLQQEAKDSSAKCPPPPPPAKSHVVQSPAPPPPQMPSIMPYTTSVVTSPSAVQRPLVFEGMVSKAESNPAVEKNSSLEQTTERKDEFICDKTYQGMQSTPEVLVESPQPSEECTTPKKEGLHGVKKFFDSIIHHETQDAVISSENLQSPVEPPLPDVHKSEKSSIKKFFQSPKSDSVKPESLPSPDLLCETKESTSFRKDAKQSIKSFFDTFKHETVEPTDSAAVKDEIDLSKKEVDNEKNLQASATPEGSKETKSFSKDTRQNIKSFFDSFKHETPEQKQTDKKSFSPVDVNQESEKNIQSSTPESPKESKSFAKDTKQNIKSFLDTFKHEVSEPKSKSSITKKSASHSDLGSTVNDEQNFHSPVTESSKKDKESSSFVKDTKQNIKSFFKHEPSDKKHKDITCKKSASHSDFSKVPVDIDSTVPKSSEVPKHKESVSFAKGAKQNVKTFFDSFKHEPSATTTISDEVQKINESFQLSAKETKLKSEGNVSQGEISNEPVSPTKSTKKGVKTFFDSFKHEPSTTARSDEVQKMNESVQSSAKETKLKSEGNVSQREIPNEPVSPTKSTKQSVKTFFDSFKHEPSTTARSDEVQKMNESDQSSAKETKLKPEENACQSEISKEPVSLTKSTKQNVKTFFDSFKHEPNTSKSDEMQKKIESSQPSAKETKLKSEGNACQSDCSKEPVSPSKSTKQNVKAFFDNFKLGDLNTDTSNKETLSKAPSSPKPVAAEESTNETTKTSKDTKQNVKTFFESFKLGDTSVDKNKGSASKMPTASEPALYKEPAEETALSHKESKHSVKKFFSFKQTGISGETDVSGSLDSQLPKKCTKDKPAKIAKSVKLDLHPTYSNGSENISASFSHMNGHEAEIPNDTKERAQSVPSDPTRSKNFSSLSEMKKPEISTTSLDTAEVKPIEQKGSRQSIKKFFDSFKHEKIETGQEPSQTAVSSQESTRRFSPVDKESKVTEKSSKEKTNKSIKRSLSDKVSREEVVQNFKGFFDSLGYKSSSKKSVRDSEHIYDVVEVKPEVVSPAVPTLHTSTEETEPASVKAESSGFKKILSPFHAKDSSKSDPDKVITSESKFEKEIDRSAPMKVKVQKSCELPKDVKVSTEVCDLSPTISEPSSPKPDKSMFDSIGENILALKEKMLHPKEKRKSEIIEDIEKGPDATHAAEKENLPKEAILSASDKVNKDNINKSKPAPPKKPTQVKELPKPKTPVVIGKGESAKESSNANPNSLYETCCIRIAVLLRDKALDIVAEHTKSPPPKPPKPTAEAIAKARAAAVSRRIEAQRLSHSVGENFRIGCDSMRFADDDTESSCDYKDVENFDYIMDYELINKYKLDSSKFDTFSVPSTCSGLTSYYTADSIMETVSLSSDISCNFRISSTSKSDLKTSLRDDTKTNFTLTSKISSAKHLTNKKVPPPIPPKPILLQNISKIKETPDDKAVSECVNGLSLSPRLKNKFSKDPAVTQKRPLMVADLKGTQFSSLQHPKKPPKPARNFDTVLKNESLKKVPCMPSDMPATSERTLVQDSSNKMEKRTKSPPRPPLPNILKRPEKPPKPDRPPPPAKMLKSLSEEIMDDKTNEKENLENTHPICKLNDTEKLPGENKPPLSNQLPISESTTDSLPLCDKFIEISLSDNVVDNDKIQFTEASLDSSSKTDFNTEQDNLNNNIVIDTAIADSLNNNIDLNSNAPTEVPKAPPRNRRIRSRTVEVAPVERQEERLKRSQSLSEIDVEKRVTFLDAEKAKIDSKSLYTTVNKNGKKPSIEKISRSSPDLVSSRPLPAPPPPPRRFRSLERGKKAKESAEKFTHNDAEEVSTKPEPKEIKPPTRRRKTDKERYLSLHTDDRKDIDASSENLKRAASVPSKPDRRFKSSPITEYDVNANISSPDRHPEFYVTDQNIPNIDSIDSIRNSNPKNKKEVNSRKKSHSSWYDESEDLDGSWEVVSHGVTDEFKESPKVPLRRKLETKRKSRETSKFYVNMNEEINVTSADERASPLPLSHKEEPPLPCVSPSPSLVDKETSPLPLDCSEKSVQTSLETLSQGIVSSHDDQSEDTDELLDLAQTLQKELSTIINRHKSVNHDSEDTPSPPLSAATSEKNLAEDFKEVKKISSVRSSLSEVWPITSSDESDVERAGEDSSNISEVSVKRKQKKIFYIAREIMTSEEAFVDALKLLNVDFKAAVEAATKQKNMSIIPDEVLAQILNHLPQLQHLNENLLMELKDRIENWDKHEKIADIIVKMGPFLKLYSWYIHDFESNVSLLEESKKRYPAFSQVVKEFEMSARCKRLALNHYMLKPIQRIPQYRLLLQEYLHHLTEDSKDYQDTVTALQIVSEVANHANDSMKQGDNAQKLISLQNSIMGHKEIVKPGRVFVKEGELMKLSRKGMQPRWFVLFNDLLLYLTSVQQGLYRINHELPLTGMKVAIPIQQDYQNEFSIISVTRSFTLAAKSQEERQEWIIALTKAIEENASKRSTFTNSRLNQKAQDKTSSEDEGAFVLGRKAPVWIPDARVTMCQLCTSEFTVTFRRHHCRACGKVICSVCSSHRISLPYLGNRIARVCDECHMRLGQGSSACTESGETDSDNQQIAVKSHLRTDNRHLKKTKRSLPSVLKEVCANDQGSTISGYLHKKVGKSWKRDWFVVKDKVLYEYKASEDVAALKSIPLLGYQIESFSEAYESVDASLLFQLTHPGQAPIVFYADTVGSTERWVSSLKTATVLE